MHGPSCRPSLRTIGARCAGVERRHALLHRDARAQTLQRLVEGGHHGVADRLDDGAVMLADDRRRDRRNARAPAVGGGVADRVVERRAALEIAEQQRHAPDRHLVAGAQHLGREQVAEGLQRGDPVGGQRVLHPAAVLDDDGAAAGRRVAQGHPVRLARRPAITPSSVTTTAGKLGRRHARSRLPGRSPACAGGRGRAAPSNSTVALLARFQRDVRPDVRRAHRPEQAELAGLDRADAGGRAQGQLDVAREVAAVVDVAGAAMRAVRQLVEAGAGGLGAAAARAEQVPAQLQHAEARRLQAGLDRVPLGHAPAAGQRQGPDPLDVDLQPVGDLRREPLGEPVPVGARRPVVWPGPPGGRGRHPVTGTVGGTNGTACSPRANRSACGARPANIRSARAQEAAGQEQAAEQAARRSLQAVVAVAARAAAATARSARRAVPSGPRVNRRRCSNQCSRTQLQGRSSHSELNGPTLARAMKRHAAIGPGGFGDGLFGQGGGRIVAGGIGHRAPDRRQRAHRTRRRSSGPDAAHGRFSVVARADPIMHRNGRDCELSPADRGPQRLWPIHHVDVPDVWQFEAGRGGRGCAATTSCVVRPNRALSLR